MRRPTLRVDVSREDDGRWAARVPGQPTVVALTRERAILDAQSLALSLVELPIAGLDFAISDEPQPATLTLCSIPGSSIDVVMLDGDRIGDGFGERAAVSNALHNIGTQIADGERAIPSAIAIVRAEEA